MRPWQREKFEILASLFPFLARPYTAIFSCGFCSPNSGQAAVIYLAPTSEKDASESDLKIFAGCESPYDTPWLREDSVFFARAVDRLAELVALPPRPFVW